MYNLFQFINKNVWQCCLSCGHDQPIYKAKNVLCELKVKIGYKTVDYFIKMLTDIMNVSTEISKN